MDDCENEQNGNLADIHMAVLSGGHRSERSLVSDTGLRDLHSPRKVKVSFCILLAVLHVEGVVETYLAVVWRRLDRPRMERAGKERAEREKGLPVSGQEETSQTLIQ